jgi:hypothetical protein
MKINPEFLTAQQEWAIRKEYLLEWVKYDMPKVTKFRLCFTPNDDYPWIEEIFLADGSMADEETIKNFQECWEESLLPKDMWDGLTIQSDEMVWDLSNPAFDAFDIGD